MSGSRASIARAKPDFVGRRSLARQDVVGAGRKQLVGLRTDDPAEVLDEGAQIVADPRQAVPMRMLGHVTSSYWSATCGRSIALGMLANGRSRTGQRIHVTTPKGFTTATIGEPVFYDPAGERIHA